MQDPAQPSQPFKRMDPPLDTNGRPWNSKLYGGDLSGKGTANVRSIVDAGIWGAEISVFERKLARTRDLDPCARSISVGEMAQVHSRPRRRNFDRSAEL